jgi:ribosome-binding protein aMBF1 (putative translation factor)
MPNKKDNITTVLTKLSDPQLADLKAADKILVSYNMYENKKSIVQKVGMNIRRLRLEKKLSMEKVSLESGIEYSQISRIERGIINTTIYQLNKIAQNKKSYTGQFLKEELK